MRYLLFCLACMPAASMAQQTPDNFNREQFEQRFRGADKDRSGGLSREEAYAAFPKAPLYFTEMDTNNDNQVTLAEVYQTRARRVEAAMGTSSMGAKYVKPGYINSDQATAASETEARDLTSSIAQKRSNEFDEFLGGDHSSEGDRDLPAPAQSSSNLVKKPF